MSFPGGSAQSPSSPRSPASGTEKSIKSCYAVVYELQNRKWVVSGEGGWSEVHLCKDSADSTHRLLAWTVNSQEVLMNCNVTAECVYKEKSKNFHSFTDENSMRYGLGFHKSEPGLKQALSFLEGVVEVIQGCMKREELSGFALGNVNAPPMLSQQMNQSGVSHANVNAMGGNSSFGFNSVQASINATYNNVNSQPVPPPNPHQIANLNNANNANNHNHISPPTSPGGSANNPKAPDYHLRENQTRSVPNKGHRPKLGDLVILPPKPKKHAQSDAKIKMPNAVKHMSHVTFNKEKGVYEGLPDQWLEELNRQFGVKPEQLDGVEIAGYESKIPRVLIDLRSRLQAQNAFKQVGIFRLAPNAEDSDNIKSLINKGTFNSNNNVDPNVYANLIKVWFRDLPVPLLGPIKPEIIEYAQTQEQVIQAIDSFQEPMKSIYLWLCDLCVECAQYESVNKMGAQNLAIVIGPNLFNTNTFENPMKAMTYSGKVVQFFQKSIEWRRNSS